MTYCLNKKSPISQTQSRLLRLLGKVLPCVTRPVVLRWSTTQVREVRVSSGEDPRPDPCVGASGMENRPQTRLADIPAAPSSAVWRQPGVGWAAGPHWRGRSRLPPGYISEPLWSWENTPSCAGVQTSVWRFAHV